jgi:hypothetical protein
MVSTHQQHVEGILRDAAAEHAELRARLPSELNESLPVDAQGLTRAIDYLAQAAGLSEDERRALVRPHGINPAVLHARIFGPAPLSRETVVASFVEGARVRAGVLNVLADRVGGAALGQQVLSILLTHPLPAVSESPDAASGLRETYAAQERAAVVIAEGLDAVP